MQKLKGKNNKVDKTFLKTILTTPSRSYINSLLSEYERISGEPIDKIIQVSYLFNNMNKTLGVDGSIQLL